VVCWLLAINLGSTKQAQGKRSKMQYTATTHPAVLCPTTVTSDTTWLITLPFLHYAISITATI